MTSVVIKTTNLQGLPVGPSHHWCVYPDSVVARAQALRLAGLSVRAIAAELGGVHPSTVHRWVTGQRRRPPKRRVARRVRSESFVANHQLPPENPVSARPAADSAPVHTVNLTVTDRK
ncbi:helix-turn-helix domain-containing protein [Hydrogenophaga sp.]|uniref:helix-turn-helix domain-containing protein n=1 Tax=Hydrogenophaga sp. TaxID=1904254 RepID=UPI003458092B